VRGYVSVKYLPCLIVMIYENALRPVGIRSEDCRLMCHDMLRHHKIVGSTHNPVEISNFIFTEQNKTNSMV
jgi:hypothetical protein